jgi:hypothetical protein
VMQKRLALFSLVLLWGTGAFGDLVFPASFEIVEETPEQFRITLTLPMVENRFLKARPLLPDVIEVDGKPDTLAGTASLTRTWKAQFDPAALAGSAIGMDGLLGSSLEVRFLLSTLDGRRHELVMRPTQAFFVVPHPPSFRELASESMHKGLRVGTRHLGLWFLLAGLIGISAAWRRTVRLAVLLSAVLLTPLFAALAGSLTLPMQGLSDAETQMATVFLLTGWMVASGLIAATLGTVESLLSGRAKHRFHALTGVLASAWIFYQAAGWIARQGPALWTSLRRLFDSFVYGWFTPFASDWAMARLRIPWLSLLVLIAGIWVLTRLSRRQIRWIGTGIVIGLAVLLLPWGVSRTSLPFLNPDAPAPAQARRILEPMLSRIYHALDLEDENQAYDRLSEEVASGLITDLYLDSRRRLIAGTREGASVAVLDVEVLDVGSPRSLDDDALEFTYPCRWTVTAKVTHWQHSHERRNLYEGDLGLAVGGDRWKLADIELRSEEREVVPGSFSSR